MGDERLDVRGTRAEGDVDGVTDGYYDAGERFLLVLVLIPGKGDGEVRLHTPGFGIAAREVDAHHESAPPPLGADDLDRRTDGFPRHASGTCAEEGVDHDVVRFSFVEESGELVHVFRPGTGARPDEGGVPDEFPVHARVFGAQAVGSGAQVDVHPRPGTQVAGGDEAVAAVASAPRKHGDAPGFRSSLADGPRHRRPRVLHEDEGETPNHFAFRSHSATSETERGRRNAAHTSLGGSFSPLRQAPPERSEGVTCFSEAIARIIPGTRKSHAL